MKPVRYTYRLRVNATAEAKLLAEWDRVRWLWNNATERFRKHLPTSNKALSDELTLLRKQEWLARRRVSGVPTAVPP